MKTDASANSTNACIRKSNFLSFSIFSAGLLLTSGLLVGFGGKPPPPDEGGFPGRNGCSMRPEYCPPKTSSPSSPVVETQMNFATGGTLAVLDKASPIHGAKVVIAPNTLGAPVETISIAYEEFPPGPLNAGAVAAGFVNASKTVILSRTSSRTLALAAEITIPYDKTVVSRRQIPHCALWDDFNGNGNYSALSILSLDREAGTVTCQSAHFSKSIKFVVLTKKQKELHVYERILGDIFDFFTNRP